MSSKTIDIADAQGDLAALISLAHAGTEVVLTQADQPVARLVALPAPSATRVPGLHPGAIWTSDDFDEPLPDALWSGEA